MKKNKEEEKNCIFCKKKIDSAKKVNICRSCRKRSRDGLSTAAIGLLGLVSFSKKIRKWLVYFMVLIGEKFIYSYLFIYNYILF